MKTLIEAKLSTKESLEILDISSEQANDRELLKKAYYKAAKESHPDAGGSEEEMKLVNEAFEVLESGVGSRPGKFDWEKLHQEYRDLAEAITKDLQTKFDAKPFIEYFSEVCGEPFTADIKWSDHRGSSGSPSSVYVIARFRNEDGSKYFEFYASAYLHEIKHGSGLKGDGGDYSLGIIVDAYFNRRKQTLSNTRWSTKQNHDVLSNPEILFPRAKITKLLGKPKTTKFTRKDFERALVSELGGKSRGKDFYQIPLSQDLNLVLFRSVFMKTAAYGINGIYKTSRVAMLPALTLPEAEETIDFYKGLQKEVRGLKTEEEIIEKTKKIIEDRRPKAVSKVSEAVLLESYDEGLGAFINSAPELGFRRGDWPREITIASAGYLAALKRTRMLRGAHGKIACAVYSANGIDFFVLND